MANGLVGTDPGALGFMSDFRSKQIQSRQQQTQSAAQRSLEAYRTGSLEEQSRQFDVHMDEQKAQHLDRERRLSEAQRPLTAEFYNMEAARRELKRITRNNTTFDSEGRATVDHFKIMTDVTNSSHPHVHKAYGEKTAHWKKQVGNFQDALNLMLQTSGVQSPSELPLGMKEKLLPMYRLMVGIKMGDEIELTSGGGKMIAVTLKDVVEDFPTFQATLKGDHPNATMQKSQWDMLKKAAETNPEGVVNLRYWVVNKYDRENRVIGRTIKFDYEIFKDKTDANIANSFTAINRQDQNAQRRKIASDVLKTTIPEQIKAVDSLIAEQKKLLMMVSELESKSLTWDQYKSFRQFAFAHGNGMLSEERDAQLKKNEDAAKKRINQPLSPLLFGDLTSIIFPGLDKSGTGAKTMFDLLKNGQLARTIIPKLKHIIKENDKRLDAYKRRGIGMGRSAWVQQEFPLLSAPIIPEVDVDLGLGADPRQELIPGEGALPFPSRQPMTKKRWGNIGHLWRDPASGKDYWREGERIPGTDPKVRIPIK